MEPIKTHDAACEAVDSATAGIPSTLGNSANMLEVSEAVDSATAGVPSTSGISANMLEVSEAADRATAGVPSTSGISESMLEVIKIERDTTCTSPSSELSTNTQGDNDESFLFESSLPSPDFTLGENLTRIDLYNALVKKSKTTKGKKGRPTDLDVNERLEILYFLMGDEYQNIIQSNEAEVAKILNFFILNCENKWKHCNRHIGRFLKQHNDWLNSFFTKDLKKVFFMENKIEKYFQLSDRQQHRQRKRLKSEFEAEPKEKLIKTFVHTVLPQQPDDPCISGTEVTQSMENVITRCIEDPIKITKISETIENPKVASPQPFTPEEALDLMTDLCLSVEAYNTLRQALENRGFSAFPPYYKVLESKLTSNTDLITKRETDIFDEEEVQE